MTALDFTERSRILGLPVGRRQLDRRKVAKVAFGVAAALGLGIVAGTVRRSRSDGLERDENGRFVAQDRGEDAGEDDRRERDRGRGRQAG